ncbi:hypothetical protein [Micromonospora sp. ATCC 39149]|uniref:Uncharacterized protein n=1 Tax=Micromonospora carbonacea TaxID=47853 RepID=A0A7D5YEW0_9ACTN|nr:hypothetical protein [Micromonospora sp. ATCC 39149]QLJ99837.1 hypothetical protein HZU44_06990 [Micromonospora carbonacea]
MTNVDDVSHGRAWSGHEPVVSVEVTTESGATGRRRRWTRRPAERGHDGGGASSGWRCRAARAGHGRRHVGRSQPVEQPWNRGGFVNDMVQRVEVMVPAE